MCVMASTDRKKWCMDGKKAKSPILPRFILVGTPKCGTTALQEAICKHPDVVPPLGSDHNNGFFSFKWNDDLPADVRMALYAKTFQQDLLSRNSNMCTGEFDAAYVLGGDEVARRIKEHIPGVKLFVVLRDPVDRALSAYNYLLELLNGIHELMGGEPYTGSFTDMVKKTLAEIDVGFSTHHTYQTDKIKKAWTLISVFEKLQIPDKVVKQTGEQGVVQPSIDDIRRIIHEMVEKFSTADGSITDKLKDMSDAMYTAVTTESITSGFYSLHLEPWFEIFGSDLLVVSSESLGANHFANTLNSIFSNIGLSPYEVPHDVKNTGRYLYASEEDVEGKALLREFYMPFNANLAKILEKHSVDTSSGLWPWLHADDTANADTP